jgi:hypothetical protein
MTDLTISDELADRIDARVERTDFESPAEYAEFVLSEVVTRVERDGGSDESAETSREGVEDRLQSLGYLEE